MKTAGLFYRERPLFGFDIGHTSIKIVQLDRSGKKIKLSGFGMALFNPDSIKQGEIVNFNDIAEAAHSLMEKHLNGRISSGRIAASLPVLHAFTRIINLPDMPEKDILEAIELEAEQYIPTPISELYLDYQLVDKGIDNQDYLVSA